MSEWLFDPPAAPSLPIVGRTERFPVRRILCVGQNYAAHAREMGAERAEPFFFSKPGDAIAPEGGRVAYPPSTTNLHHEVELVCAIGPRGTIVGWAVGCDLTRRDLQAAAKAAGRPWDAAKGFDQSAPCGPITLGPLPDADGEIALDVNGRSRQRGVLSDMIWAPEEIVVELGKLWRLMPGDLIFTGTPEGVGPVSAGDRIDCRIAGLAPLSFEIAG